MSPADTPAADARAARAPRAIAIVPARLASQRLPRKMLLRAAGRALFAHTAHNVARSGAFARVVVATDSAEIAEEARREGLEACETRADHASGTDRAAEAWRALAAAGERADVVVDVQGDEPELDPGDLLSLVRAFGDPRVEAATLAAPLEDESEHALATIVKVVADRSGDALYFSRAPIPFRGHARQGLGHAPSVTRERDDSARTDRERESGREGDLAVHRRHVGVYAFRPEALLRFCELPRGVLEAHENLEQLRWLEAGRKMRVVAASHAPQGIDTMHDFEQFVARCTRAGIASAAPPRAPGVARGRSASSPRSAGSSG
jgi:3-deoxy-manno-octulosonate cytidylyltransferase (CMP-KDO synthetase)